MTEIKMTLRKSAEVDAKPQDKIKSGRIEEGVLIMAFNGDERLELWINSEQAQELLFLLKSSV